MGPAYEAMGTVVDPWAAPITEPLATDERAFIDVHQARMMSKETLTDEVREVGQGLGNRGGLLVKGDRCHFPHFFTTLFTTSIILLHKTHFLVS